MKKLISIILLLSIILGLPACGSTPSTPRAEKPGTSLETLETPEAPAKPEPPAEEIPVEPDSKEDPIVMKPGPIPGLVSLVEETPETAAKILHNEAAGSVTIDQQEDQAHPPVVQFVRNGYLLEGENWSLSGKMIVDITYYGAQMAFRGFENNRNFAEIIILRQQTGTNGVRRNITRDGTRLQKTGNEVVLNSLQDAVSWPVDFHLIVCDGWLYFFLQEPGEKMELVTSYAVDWKTSSPRFELTKNAKVTFSNLTASNEAAKVRQLYQSLAVSGEVQGKAKLLFLGNSGLFYYDTPNTFSRMAREAGYLVEVNTIARSSATLTMFLTSSDHLHDLAMQELPRGYDMVFLQELSSCINTTDKELATQRAVRALDKLIRENGSKTALYVRAPRNDYGTANTPLNAARQYDELFTPLGQELNAECYYVNRAFALAYKEMGLNLWHTDNAHQNAKGTYLCACVLFATVFDTSCQVLGDDCLPAEEAQLLRSIADRVVLGGELPW